MLLFCEYNNDILCWPFVDLSPLQPSKLLPPFFVSIFFSSACKNKRIYDEYESSENELVFFEIVIDHHLESSEFHVSRLVAQVFRFLEVITSFIFLELFRERNKSY